jgi:hypothetical protein
MLQKSEDIKKDNQRLSIEGQTIQWSNKPKTKNKQTNKTNKATKHYTENVRLSNTNPNKGTTI